MKQMPAQKKIYLQRAVRKGQGGQVLALALIAMVAILVAGMILFDVHTVIRGKVKGQNAVDAAALTGATWQLHALNLIGELNLVKATAILTSDSAAAGSLGYDQGTGQGHLPSGSSYRDEENATFNTQRLYDDLNRIGTARDDLTVVTELLSQMQTRVSFVLPILGYGAAQQAAKNNGIDYNSDGAESIRDFYNEILDDELYGDQEIAPKSINGYQWRYPYALMIHSLLGNNDRGIAVGTKINRLGLPSTYLDETSNNLAQLLTQKRFYEAILANSWCELKDILNKNFNGNWWGSFDMNLLSTFIGESEILPLYVSFSADQSAINIPDLGDFFPQRFKNDVDIVLQNDSCELLLNTTGGTKRCIIKSDGTVQTKESGLTVQPNEILNAVYENGNTYIMFNTGSDFNWCLYDSDNWYEYSESFKTTWTPYLRSSFKPGYDYTSGALSWFEMAQHTRTVSGNMFDRGSSTSGGKGFRIKNSSANQALTNAQADLKTGLDEIQTDALAKPFGRIKIDGQYKSPIAAGRMVLPVFTEVALIPISLEPVYGTGTLDRDWLTFLTKYLPALGRSQTLENAYNSLSTEDKRSTNRYHHALMKLSDPEWREQGIKWLNTPIAFDKETKLPVRYNKDNCNCWPSGGSGTHVGPGSIH